MGCFPHTYICHRCNGWENSHLKMHTVCARDPDFEGITSFSPADIRNYTKFFSEAGKSVADRSAKNRYSEIRLTKLRLVSMFEYIITPNETCELDKVARETLIKVSKEELHPFSLTPDRDYVFDFYKLNGALKLFSSPISAIKPLDDRILRNIGDCETLMDFHESCADDDVDVSYDICTNCALKGMEFVVDGVEAGRSAVTPILLSLMGIRYMKSEHWEPLSDLQELQEDDWC